MRDYCDFSRLVFRQKRISKRNFNLHAPFWDISNPDLSRLNYFEWFWMVRIPNAKIVYQNPKSHFTKESTPIKRILLFPIRSENFGNFTYNFSYIFLKISDSFHSNEICNFLRFFSTILKSFFLWPRVSR